MVSNRVFDRFPGLRVAYLEGGAAWTLRGRRAPGRVVPALPSAGTDRVLRLPVGRSMSSYLRELVQAGRVVFGCEGGEAQLTTAIDHFGATPVHVLVRLPARGERGVVPARARRARRSSRSTRSRSARCAPGRHDRSTGCREARNHRRACRVSMAIPVESVGSEPGRLPRAVRVNGPDDRRCEINRGKQMGIATTRKATHRMRAAVLLLAGVGLLGALIVPAGEGAATPRAVTAQRRHHPRGRTGFRAELRRRRLLARRHGSSAANDRTTRSRAGRSTTRSSPTTRTTRRPQPRRRVASSPRTTWSRSCPSCRRTRRATT